MTMRDKMAMNVIISGKLPPFEVRFDFFGRPEDVAVQRSAAFGALGRMRLKPTSVQNSHPGSVLALANNEQINEIGTIVGQENIIDLRQKPPSVDVATDIL